MVKLECFYCRGEMKRGKTVYTINRKGYHFLVDEVPAWVCQQCGQVYFEGDEVARIQEIVQMLDREVEKLTLS